MLSKKEENQKLIRNIIIGVLIIIILVIGIVNFTEDRLVGFESKVMKHEISVIGDRMCSERNCNYDSFVNVPHTGIVMDKIVCDCSDNIIIDLTKE